MTIELIDLNPEPEFAKAKSIVVNGAIVGDVRPTNIVDQRMWHAVIRLKDHRFLGADRLLQGHGDTELAAIGEVVIHARAQRDALIERLAVLEVQLGIAGKSDEEVKQHFEVKA